MSDVALLTLPDSQASSKPLMPWKKITESEQELDDACPLPRHSSPCSEKLVLPSSLLLPLLLKEDNKPSATGPLPNLTLDGLLRSATNMDSFLKRVLERCDGAAAEERAGDDVALRLPCCRLWRGSEGPRTSFEEWMW